MNKKDFNNISMIGRYAYILLCVEKIFTVKYPNKNFKNVFSFLWKGTEENIWNNIAEFAQDLTNEFLFASPNYDEENFMAIKEVNFKEYYDLFSDMKNISNKCFTLIYDFLTVYENTGIIGFGKESIDIVFNMIDVLIENEISLPDLELVTFSKFAERNGWGNNFNGSNLSTLVK